MSTLGDVKGHGNLSSRECAAMRLLNDDGLDPQELAFMFERKDSVVYDHITGRCSHSRLDRTGEEWAHIADSLVAARVAARTHDLDQLEGAALDLLARERKLKAETGRKGGDSP